MASRPTIDINFKQLATTLLERSERGTAMLLLNDSTFAEDMLFELSFADDINTLGATVTGNEYSDFADDIGSLLMTQVTTSGSVIVPSGTACDGILSTAIKMDNSAKITFTTVTAGKLYLYASSEADTFTVTIDGTEVSLSDLVTKISLAAGSHTITKGTDDTYLYYVGVVCEATDSAITQEYKTIDEINEAIYTTENLVYIKNCMAYAPYEVVVISANSTALSTFTPAITKNRSTGWIGTPIEDVQSDLATWIKSMENQGYTYKAVGTVANTDSMQYVYFDQIVTDTSGEVLDAAEYIPSLLGILASCNILRGCTNYLCSDLSEVVEVSDVDAAIDAGQLVLANDVGGVKIVTGINSLVTLNGSTATEDMQYIETVEAMNLIKDDIRDEFKNTYQGKFRNKLTNQMLFIAAVNEYFNSLAAEDILDAEYDNFAEIDVDTQRAAWVGSGKSEAADWSDDYVKKMSYKRSVFVAASIKVLNSMENLEFTIELM